MRRAKKREVSSTLALMSQSRHWVQQRLSNSWTCTSHERVKTLVSMLSYSEGA